MNKYISLVSENKPITIIKLTQKTTIQIRACHSVRIAAQLEEQVVVVEEEELVKVVR